MFKTKQAVDKHVSNVLSQLTTELERKRRGYQIAKLYCNVHVYDDALRYLKDYLCIHSDNPSAYKLLGQITEHLFEQRKSSWTDCVEAYKRSFQLDSSQKDVLIKVCELYYKHGESDVEGYQYWLLKLQNSVPQSPLVLSMKDHLALVQNDQSKDDLEHLMRNELIQKPQNDKLRGRLLELLIEQERGGEVEQMIAAVEMDKLHCESRHWYSTILRLCKNSNFSSEQRIWIKLWALISMARLSLQYNQVAECIDSLFRLDQYLDEVIKDEVDKLEAFCNESYSQLLYLCGCVLQTKSSEGQLSASEGLEWTCASFSLSMCTQEFIVGPAFQPESDVIVKLWKGLAISRLCQIDNFLQAVEKRKGTSIIMRLLRECSHHEIRQTLFEKVFSTPQLRHFSSSSYLVKRASPEGQSNHIVVPEKLREWNTGVMSLFAHDLNLLTWVLIHSPEILYDWDFNMELPYGCDQWAKASVESLCELDFQAFLVAVTFLARQTVANPESSMKPFIVCKRLCSREQSEWWAAAYRLKSGHSGDGLCNDRRIVQQGLNIVRANRGLPLTTTVHLANFFANKKLSAGLPNRTQLQSLAVHYWSQALALMKVSSQKVNERLFAVADQPSRSELAEWATKGERFLAQHAIDTGVYEDALKRLLRLCTPDASFTLAHVYATMAAKEQDRRQCGENVGNGRVKELLEKARQALFDTMDRLQQYPDDILKASVAEELIDIESKLDKVEKELAGDSVEDLPRERSVSRPLCDQTVAGASLNESFQTIKGSFIPSDSVLSNSRTFPSPDRMDAQIRSLQSIKDILLRTVLSDLQECKQTIRELQERVVVLEKQIERQQWWNATQNEYQRVNHVSLPSASYSRADEPNASFSQCADGSYNSRAANLQVFGSNNLSPAVSPATSNQTSLRLNMQQSFGASTPLKQVPPNPQIPTEFVNSARSASLSQPNSSLVASTHAINSNIGNFITSTRSPAGAINQYEEQKAVSKQSDPFALGTSVAAKTSDDFVKSASSTQQITGRSQAGFTQPATGGNQGISTPFATSKSPAASTQPATGGSQGVLTQFRFGGSPATSTQPATGGSQGVLTQFGSGGSLVGFTQPATGGSQSVFTHFGSGGSLVAFAQPATGGSQTAPTQPAIGGIQTAKSDAKPTAIPANNQRTAGQQMPVSQGEKAVVTSTAHSQLTKQDVSVSSVQKPFAGGGFNFSGSIPLSATKASSSFSGATSSATVFGTAALGSKFLPSSTFPTPSLSTTTTSSVATSANVVNLSVSSSSTLPNKESENMFNKQQRPDSNKTASFAVTSTVGIGVASKPVSSVSSTSSFITGFTSSDKNAGITTSSQAIVSQSVGAVSTTTSSGASIFSTQPVKSLFGEGQNVPSIADLAKQSSSLPFAKKLPVENKEITETVPPVFGDTRTNSQQRSSEGIDDDNEPVDEYEPDVSFKPVISLPALVEVKTGEELEEKVFGERAKLYRLDDDKQWKERGIGEIKIMKHKDTGKYRIVMRREQVLKVCANHYITADMKLLAKGDTSWCWIAQDFTDDSTKVEQFCAKFKNIEIAQKFQDAFMEGCSGDSGAKQATTAKGTTSLAELLKSPGCAASNASAAVSSGALTVVTAQTSTVPAATSSLIVKQGQLTTGESKPLSELFKKAEGEWDCSSCYVRNKSSSLKCPACNTPKPAEQTPSTLTPVVTTNQNNKQAVTSEENKPLSELFKKAEGEWDCPSCYVRNKSTVLKCPACDTPKPGTSAAVPVQPLASTTGTLQFGAKGGFQFGSVKSDVSSTPADNAANKTVGSFGGFNIMSNQPTVGKACDTAATNQPVKPFAGFSFTSNQPAGQADSSTAKAVIQPSSAVSTTASMAAQFSFITTSSSQPASTTTKGFSFVQPSSTQATSASTWQPVGGFTSAVSQFSNDKPKQESSTSKIPNKNNSLTSSGGVLASTDDEVIYVRTEKAQPTAVEAALEWQLPANFYLDTGKHCSGCIGCDPDAFDFTTIGRSATVATSDQKVAVKDENKENSVTILGSKNVTDFAALAANNMGDFSFGKSAAEKPFSYGKKIFEQRSGDKEDSDEEGDESVESEPNVHFEPIVHLPQVETKTGEEDEDVVFSERAKLYRLDNMQWKERGVGNMKILRHKHTGKYRLLMRREQVLKLACNHSLTVDLQLKPMASSETAWCWIAVDYSDGEATPESFSIKFKNKEQAMQFKQTFEKCQQEVVLASKSAENDVQASEGVEGSEDEVQASEDVEGNEDEVQASEGAEGNEDNAALVDSFGSAMFDKRATLALIENGTEKKIGMGNLVVIMGEEAMCIKFADDEQHLLHEHQIGSASTITSDRKKKSCTWVEVAAGGQSQTLTAQFSSPQAVDEFVDIFQQGIECAEDQAS